LRLPGEQAILGNSYRQQPSASELTDIAFIDLEASGLSARSWPIEAGWCFARGKPQAMLIKPHENWSTDDWDKKAEALHGIAYDHLAKKGEAAKKVCEALNKALTGLTVYSDAPDWDGFWLYRLFDAAKIKQTFKLSDFSLLMASVPPEKLDALIDEAERRAPRRHRAIPDVEHMRALYDLAAKII